MSTGKYLYSSTLFAWLCCSSIAPASEIAATAVTSGDDTAIELCRTFADKAAESKTAHQRSELLKLKEEIEAQLLKLDEKTKNLESWIDKREAIQASVSSSLVKMYTNVEPEIAAQQLQKLDVMTSSALLQRLNAKQSGEIVTAMDVVFASKVLKVMLTDAAKIATNKEAP